MSGLLSGDLIMSNEGERSFGYWLTLVFEAMRRIGFGFTKSTHASENQGTYYIWPTDPSQEETVAIGASFRSMWDRLSMNDEPTVLEFWPALGEQYFLQVVIRSSPPHHMQASLQIPIESLPVLEGGAMAEWLVETKRRLRTWLGGIREMAELCEPSNIQLEWERWGARYWVGSLDATSDIGSSISEQPDYLALRREVRTIPLSDGALLHLVDPFPIPHAQSWIYAPLELDDS